MRTDNLIIDGTNLEFRIFYIARNSKTVNEEGEQPSCIYKFLQTFNTLVEKFDPTDVYCTWDRKLIYPATNFRKQILVDQYKAGRTKPPDVEELYDQEVRLIEMLESLGVKNMYPNVLEADDVCAFLAHELPGNNVVVSVDHDLLQLVNEHTSVYNLKEVITIDNFESKKGVPPNRFALYKAIKGDTSDNINGLVGYGEVKSRKLAADWNSNGLTEEQKQLIERNLRLIDLNYGYNYQPDEKQKYIEQMHYVKDLQGDIDKFKALCERHNFEPFLNNIGKWKRLINRNNIVNIVNSLS